MRQDLEDRQSQLKLPLVGVSDAAGVENREAGGAGFNPQSNAVRVTCKFTKRVLVLSGVNTFLAKQWAIRFLNRLMQGDWGIPKVLLSDRDRKFLSDMWKTIFKAPDVDFLFSTAYHPQTDGRRSELIKPLRYLCAIT
jgi:hypothetical protein